MKEEDIKVVLKDFAIRVGYARENMLKDPNAKKAHLKKLFKAKEALMIVVDNSVGSILKCFDAIDELDNLIIKIDKHAEKFSEDEISKFDKE